MGPLFQSGSKSLLGVHSPDEVMTSLEGGELEYIGRSESRVWDSIPLTGPQRLGR